MLADAVRSLREEARACNERRLLVLAGSPSATREAAIDALDAASVPEAETTVIGPGPIGDCERLDVTHSDRLLGRTRSAVVVDAHAACHPNALGRAVGAVDGGGLLVLLTPPLETWPDRRDGFDESLAVPPAGVESVAGNFRTRLVETLRAHPGVAIVDVDAGTVERDGLTHPAPRLGGPAPSPPADHEFPAGVYGACRTTDQVAAVHALERLRQPDTAVVVEADRGRGKSSAAGLAAAALALAGNDVLVTAPAYHNAAEVFARARERLSAAGALRAIDDETAPRHLRTGTGQVRFLPAVEATELPADPDAVIVDEAAALPVRVLSSFLHAPAVAFATTVHGYEGAGRGFSVRFRDRLAGSDREVTDVTMTEPIRYAPGDPVEVWAFRALLLDARPPVELLVTDADPSSVSYARLSPADLLADEHLLREAFGLLVLAHYRTEPADLARLLDAPNVSVRALTHDGHVVSVALLAREGDLPAETRARMYDGGRIAGNMLPDVLTTQLRDESAGEPRGMRVLRIATHHAVRSRGLGSELLSRVRAEFAADLDWLGVGYGATPALVRFWADNGYVAIHLSTSRNESSGEYSVLMLDPTSDAGRTLRDRHASQFASRIAAVLSDALSDADPDVVRATLAAVPGPVAPSLDDWEWRHVASAAFGPGMFDVAPDPYRRLAVAILVERPDAVTLTDRQERLLVRRVLQAHSWATVAAEFGYPSTRVCMQSLGETFQPIVDHYGNDTARREADRYR